MTEPIDQSTKVMSNTEGEDTQGENLLVEMSATMNNLARAYDQKDDRLMKYLMDKVYGLSHKGISHLMQLDKANEELASLREQLATEQDMRSTAEFANRMIIKDLNEKLKQWKEDFDKLHATSVLLLQQIKQKEDENRELREILQILQPWISGVGWIHHNGDFFNMTDRIKKAKNLSA